MLMDCHTHTKFSFDSDAGPAEMLDKAKSLGLAAWAVTDHCECNCWYPREHYSGEVLSDHFDFGSDYERSVAAVTEMKRSDDMNIICCIEMGQPLQALDIAEKIVSDSRLDFVLASLHQLSGEEDFYFIKYSECASDRINSLCERYFREIYEMCRWGKFDILAHLTYFLRYMRENAPDISRYDDIIAESFRELIAKDKGIEINTSGLRNGGSETFPTLKYVKLFRDLGGELISVGSDAHTPQDIGSGTAQGAEIAAAAGFTRLCCFKKRKPYFINIY